MMTNKIEVTRTYLQLTRRDQLKPARLSDLQTRTDQAANYPPSFYRDLYGEVGRFYHWTDRLPWTDEQIAAHLQLAENSLWLMTYDGETSGYFELRKCEDGSTEVAYFGLMPQFIGRGFGKHLLACATEQAWADGANRVWLHTCTLDDPAALPNYLKRGFKPFKTERYLVEKPV